MFVLHMDVLEWLTSEMPGTLLTLGQTGVRVHEGHKRVFRIHGEVMGRNPLVIIQQSQAGQSVEHGLKGGQ